MNSRTVTHPDGTTFTEVYEDAALSAAVEAGPVEFRVFDDEWNDDFTVRTIKQAEILP